MSWIKAHRYTIRNIAIGAGLAGLTFFIWLSVGMYRQRKATEAMIASRDHLAVQSNEEKPETTSFFQAENVVFNGKTYHRNSYVKAVLCMGVDRKGTMTEKTTTGMGGQADGLFLIAQDTARNSLRILMIPRDTMTEITLTDLSGNVLGKDTQHLTLAYAYGDGQKQSCEYMVEAVSRLFDGLAIDYYMAADIDVISILNDAVGGVTVTIPTEGMEERDPAFIKGSQVTLHGKQADTFVRFRDINRDNSALYRLDQQQEYITQYFQAVRDRSVKDSQIVPHLFEQIQDYMITDMGKELYLKMAMDALTGEGLTSQSFFTVPGIGTATEWYDEFHVDKEALKPILLELFYREVNG